MQQIERSDWRTGDHEMKVVRVISKKEQFYFELLLFEFTRPKYTALQALFTFGFTCSFDGFFRTNLAILKLKQTRYAEPFHRKIPLFEISTRKSFKISNDVKDPPASKCVWTSTSMASSRT